MGNLYRKCKRIGFRHYAIEQHCLNFAAMPFLGFPEICYRSGL